MTKFLLSVLKSPGSHPPAGATAAATASPTRGLLLLGDQQGRLLGSGPASRGGRLLLLLVVAVRGLLLLVGEAGRRKSRVVLLLSVESLLPAGLSMLLAKARRVHLVHVG